MGTWGDGPFDNDDAGDWVYEAEEAGDAADFVRETLGEVRSDEYLEADVASRAIAAAAWVASALPGQKSVADDGGPEEAPPPLTPELRDEAIRALRRVLATDSEWLELWEDADGEGAALSVRDLIEVLETS